MHYIYQREVVLPIYIDWNLIEYNDNYILKGNESNKKKKKFLETFNKMNETKKCIFDDATKTFKSHQQGKNLTTIRVNPKTVLEQLQNHKCGDRKGGKLVKPWIGLYMVTTSSSKKQCAA